jgi:hypothetical protein
MIVKIPIFGVSLLQQLLLVMDVNESDSEGSNHSLDEDLALEVLASSSSSKFQHQYPEKDDDMAYFASICTSNSKPAHVKNVFAMLLDFACCKVFESIKSNVSRTDKKNLWILCCNELRAFIFNYPTTKEAKGGVLKNFPDQTWPAGFFEYVQKQLWKEPNKKALKSLPEYNKLRRCLWHDIALTKATNNMKYRLQANAKNPVVLTASFTKDHFLKNLYLAALRSLEEVWGYPVCWISFRQMGLPALASHGQISPLFNSGIPITKMTQGLGPMEAALGIGSKVARRQFHESLQDKRPPPGKDSGGRKRNKYESPTTSSSPSFISGDMTKLDLACYTMEKEIKLMEDLGMAEEEVREMKVKLLKLYQKLRQHTTESFGSDGLVRR